MTPRRVDETAPRADASADEAVGDGSYECADERSDPEQPQLR